MGTAFATNIHHEVLGVLLAVHNSFDALRTGARHFTAALVGGAFAMDIYHTIPGVLPVVHSRFAAPHAEGFLSTSGIVATTIVSDVEHVVLCVLLGVHGYIGIIHTVSRSFLTILVNAHSGKFATPPSAGSRQRVATLLSSMQLLSTP